MCSYARIFKPVLVLFSFLLILSSADILSGQQMNTRWIAVYDGPSSGSDIAWALVIDDDGNSYVTGQSEGDYLTVKYDRHGNEVWTARYDGPAGDEDRAWAIALDKERNVYVTGESTGSGGDLDYATVKYSNDGDQLWAARYEGSGGYDDSAIAIQCDQSGNVYVTGGAYESDTHRDFATIKYSADGTELWVVTYHGLGDGNDRATAMTIDAGGYIYVTGGSWGMFGAEDDYVTIKYNEDGDQVWYSIYNGTGDGNDLPFAVTTDMNGNVYVTGRSVGAGTDTDIATVKYSSTGTELWASRYDGPVSGGDVGMDLVVDSDENVYVAGLSEGDTGNWDYATIRYDGSGNQIWVERYDGLDADLDNPEAIALDCSGNVCVSGYSKRNGTYDIATFKYDADGNELWSAFYDGPTHGYDYGYGMAVDGAGNIYTAGCRIDSGESGNYFVMKYASCWFTQYDGPVSGEDVPRGIASDEDGNVCVTGSSEGSGADLDVVTAGYDRRGDLLWMSRFEGPGNGDDVGYDIAVDDSGNSYVTGYCFNTTEDILTIKYGPDGTELWTAVYAGGSGGTDVGTSIALGQDGSVYVTGHSYTSGGTYDIITVKYSPSGTQSWVRIYDGSASGTDAGTDLGLDAGQNVYVGGWTTGSDNTYDYVLIKYSSAGVRQWVRTWAGSGSGYDIILGVAVDPSGNSHVTGYTYESGTLYDCTTLKYNSAGTFLWSQTHDSGAGGYDYGTDLVLDGTGNVYVTGNMYRSGTGYDMGTIKYNSNGIEQWIAFYDGPASANDYGNSIAIDNFKSVYVTGSSDGVGTGEDLTAVKYDSQGNERWAARYNGPGNGDDTDGRMVLDPQGNVFVAGSCEGRGTGSDYTVIMYQVGPPRHRTGSLLP